MRSQPAERIAKTYRLDKTRVAALKRLSEGLEFKPTQTVLIEKAIDLLIAHFASRMKRSR